MALSLFKDPKCGAFFEYFGLVVFSYALVKMCCRIFNNVGTFFLGLGKINIKKYGSWAVVTGCTDGIGKSYTEALAKRGLNIVLVSRTLSKLEAQAKELEEKFSIHTKVISADFTEQSSIYEGIKKQLSELPIAILVNNVGMGFKHPEYSEAILADEKFTDDMINCNITSVTKMTGIVLPGMVQRKGGVIVNISSASGRIPTPYLALYSSSKAYMDFFSRSIDIEYKSKGIIVQSVCPYFVSTKLSGTRKSLTSPSPSEYVKSALDTIGSQRVTNGYLLHNIQGWVLENLLPRALVDHLMSKALLGGRKKFLARQKRLEAEQKKE